MKIKNSSLQFVMDGLIGVAVALPIFLIMTPVIWNSVIFTGDFFEYVRLMFFISKTYDGDYMLGPMPLVILTAFISVGLIGQFLESNPSGKKWIVLVAQTSIIPFWVGLGLSVIYGIFLGVPYIRYFVFVGVLGAVFGLLIGILVGLIFNLQKRLYKIIIGAISSVVIGYGIGYIILILILTPRD